jgi:hypothetical protein
MRSVHMSRDEVGNRAFLLQDAYIWLIHGIEWI